MKTRTLTLLTLVVVLCLTPDAFAQKKGGGDKGGGGGGEGSTSELDYDVVLLTGLNEAPSVALAISEPRVDDDPSINGSIYVCGKMAINKVESAVRIGLWRIDSNGIVAETIDHGDALYDCNDVNNNGMIAGLFQDHATVLTAEGNRIDLPVPSEATWSSATSITNSDTNGLARVVGNWRKEANGQLLAIGGRQWWIDIETNECIYYIDFGDFDLPDFNPIDINQQGDMVGWQATWDNQPFLKLAAWMVAPNVWLPESLSGFVDVDAIDEEGNIVGNWRSENTNNQGVILLADGTLINLTELGRRKTEANDIATVDGVVQVVGNTDDSSGLGVGYVWTNGELIELDKLVGSGQAWIGGAIGINSSGAICGSGQFGSRRQRWEYGFLLLPKTTN